MANPQKQRAREPRALATTSQQPVLLRTCGNCFHAKIRCDRSNLTGSCDRCKRLNKECVFPAARRRTNLKRDARIEALEAKLDMLLNGPDKAELAEKLDQVTLENANLSTPDHSSSSIGPRSVHEDGDCIDIGLMTLEIAESLLQRFKTEMTPHFPFVVVAPHVTAEQLRHEKPHLFLSILVAASYDNVAVQRSLEGQMKQVINTVFGGVVSLDMLQGLLVYLAWTHYRSKPRAYSQYLQLAISIVVDLRLDRPWRKGHFGLEERRATLGCYYLSSTVAILQQKLQAFPYTNHMDECMKTLSKAPEYATDNYIYFIIQLQRMMERIEAISTFLDPFVVDSQISELKLELENLRLHAPSAILESQMLTMHFHIVELYLCHIGLSDPSGFGNNMSPWRLDLMGTGLVSAKSLLSAYLALPLQSEIAFNNSEWMQIGFALTIAARLAVKSATPVMEEQTAHLRQFLGMSEIFKDVLIRLRYLVSHRLDSEDEAFYHFEQQTRNLQNWFESQSISYTRSPKPRYQEFVGPNVMVDNTFAYNFETTNLFSEDTDISFLVFPDHM